MTAILCLNVGSASLKFSGYRWQDGTLRRVFRGGQDAVMGTSRAPIRSDEDASEDELRADGPGEGDEDGGIWQGLVRALLPRARTRLGGDLAVGHRIVHGGDRTASERVTPALLAALDALTPLAPSHQRANLAPARLLLREAPDVPQVAVFDTAFHATMPALARALPLAPEALGGVRRYGFHGLSFRSVAQRMARLAPAPRRVVAAHLSGGASLCAMLDGRSVDATMGATPLDGVMMGTRSGALDPGLLLHLMRRDRLDADAMEDLVAHRSGLLGVSGLSADTRDLLASDAPQASFALRLFCRAVAKEVAAMATSLGGLDALVFTGGAGSEQPAIRAEVCGTLGWMGIALDEEANAGNAERVSTPTSRVAVHALETEEERMIAEDVALWLDGRADV